MNNISHTTRSIIYVILLTVIISCLFAPYWARSGAIIANVLCALAWSALGLVVQQVPKSKLVNKSIRKNELALNAAIGVIVLLPALFIPSLWYLSGFNHIDRFSFWEECLWCAFIISLFVIFALELQMLLNNKEAIYTSPYKIIIVAGISVFGFTGLKSICQFVSHWSGLNWIMSMLLFILLVFGPIAIIGLIFFFYIKETK